jgi:hypothetical protein
MNENEAKPAIECVRPFEGQAREELSEFMEGFGNGQCVDTKRFFDPVLEFTLGKKPASKLQGILVLNNWGDTTIRNKSYEDALALLNNPFQGPDLKPSPELDLTLKNLLHPASPWRDALGQNGSWIAMNAAWGMVRHKQKHTEGQKSESRKPAALGESGHRKALAVWGGVIHRLRQEAAPINYVVIAGEWGRWPDQSILVGENRGIPAAAYYPRWFLRERDQEKCSTNDVRDLPVSQQRRKVSESSYLVCRQLAGDEHEIRFMPHPSAWTYLDGSRCVPPAQIT